ncbi:hypothetical protein KBD71_05685 [Candidatus Woesebacteria bacterium]|nr:hypothetical protein [Candidatus Woesebacteria bacterium]
MTTIEFHRADPLIAEGVLSQDQVNACNAFLSSLRFVIVEISRAEDQYARDKKYPPGYEKKKLPETLEKDIDDAIKDNLVPESFYLYLQRVLVTDRHVLNELIERHIHRD